jgi:hypothetical protein
MAKYVIFIYSNESELAKLTPEQGMAVLDGHQAFADKHGASIRGGGRIGPTSESVTVEDGRVRAGHIVAGTELVPTGYYLVEADSADEAVEIAHLVPAPAGGVEVRPLI